MTAEYGMIPFGFKNLKFVVYKGTPLYVANVVCPHCSADHDRIIAWPIGYVCANRCLNCKMFSSHPFHYCNERYGSRCPCYSCPNEDTLQGKRHPGDPCECIEHKIHTPCHCLEISPDELLTSYPEGLQRCLRSRPDFSPFVSSDDTWTVRRHSRL